uniref:Reverse transcriptase domain-containing protein n=1 Tax=Tanacetum cinerariifolium TaxID=118510 RepID=A0A6L2LXA3_TANCI|nr:reverse transcriptase domain-containing protein [Tanacetum cinerariifolium]
MQTRSSSRLVSNPFSNLTPSTNPNPQGRNRRRSKQRIEEFNLDELSSPIVMMADQRTMAQLLQEPTEDYEDAIIVPAITADNFELKHGLLTLVQNKQFFGHDKEDPHAHIRYFNQITSTLKFPNVPNTACPHHGFLELHQLDTFYNALNSKDQDSLNSAAGGNFLDKMPCECLAIIESKSKVCYSHNKPVVAKVSTNTSTFGISPNVAELKDMVKALLLDKKSQNMQNQFTNLIELITKFVNTNSASTSSSGTLPSNSIANPRKATKDTMHPTNNESTEDVQPPVVQSKSLILTSNPVNSSIIEPINSSVSALSPNLRPSIPYPSRMQDQKLRDKANDQQCLALADLDASINLMPLSVWDKLSLPDLSPTCMTLELSDHWISRPIGVAKDVYVKVGTFHFPSDFVVVDFDADPRVPLNLRRSFLKTGRALIDVFEGELTLRVGKEAITLNLDQTSRYSANYSDMMVKRIDVIDMACEEYSQEVMGFSDVIATGNPTPYYDPIVSTNSLTLTPFRNSDFLLEEVDAFLAIKDDPTSPEVDRFYLDSEGDILLLEAFLNDDPSLPPPNQRNYLPEVRKELKIYEAKFDKSSIDEPPEVKLKDLPPHLKYAFLKGDDKLPVIIAKDLSVEEKTDLIIVMKSHKRAIAWKLFDIKGIDPEFYTYKILMEEEFEPTGGFSVIENEDNELILTRLVMGWRVCIDYRKLNKATRKDHFPLLFMDQMLERLAGNQYYCFLDGFSGYFQIPIDPKDQEKTTFTCPYGTFAYRRMPFGLCNASGTFQRCMMAIFYDMIEKTVKVFMDDFSIFENSFQSYLSYLERMLKKCEDTNLWIEVDKAKVDVITKLPHPISVNGIQSFLGHAGFYIRFIKDFSKIARPMTRLLEKDTLFIFSKECVEAFLTLKRKLTEAPILIALDWDMSFELMCDASDFSIGAVLGQRQDKHFRPIHYASKTMTKAESNYTTTKKEMLVVVYAFEKFRSYLIMNKSIMYTDHFALKYLFAKKDLKARLL